MVQKMPIAPELVAAGKRAYEQTDTPQREIAAMMGIAGETLRDRAREWGWVRWSRQRRALDMLRTVHGAAVAPAVTATPRGEPMPGAPLAPEQRAALAERIQQVVERQMSAVERLIEREASGDSAAITDNARALAGIARTLREVALLNKPDDAMARHEADNDPIPCDIDAFREELARRIRGFVATERARESEGSGEDTGSLG